VRFRKKDKEYKVKVFVCKALSFSYKIPYSIDFAVYRRSNLSVQTDQYRYTLYPELVALLRKSRKVLFSSMDS